jgi:Tfp pilus assembly protein PilV
MKKLLLVFVLISVTLIGFSQVQNAQKAQKQTRVQNSLQTNNEKQMNQKQLRVKTQVQKNYQIQKTLMNQQRTGAALMHKQMLKKKNGL